MTGRRTFRVLSLAAVGLVVTLAVCRIVLGGATSASPEAMLPVLVASGGMCVVGLAWARHPTVAWLALIVALAATTIDLATFGREQRADIEPDTWRWIAIAIVLAALFTTASAAAYAAQPGRRVGRWVAPIGGLAVAAVFTLGVWALATPDPAIATTTGGSALGDLGVVTRAFLVTTTGLTLLGVLGDLRPAAGRATRRLAVSAPAGRIRFGIAWLRALVDELTPGRARERRAAEAERARLARDLHAVVVPDLRRALREAEDAGSVERMAGSLRESLRQVESMMDERDAIGLEIGGLVPALESLAERIEDRSDVRVTIDVVDDPSQEPGVPPRDVVAAALRIATLGLDNVARHAPTAAVRLTVATGAARVRLSIEDDGPGAPPEVATAALEEGRRGLADMATEAALCGASLRTGRGEGERGMIVAFDWPAR
jgi:signal transduction histidine kinase